MTDSCESSKTEHLHLLLDAFRACAWSEILDQVGDKDYIDMAHAFLDESAKVGEECNEVQSSVWRLLALACSMQLVNNNPNEPFASGFMVKGKQAITPNSFTDIEIEFFTAIIDCIDHPILKARLADLVWLRHMPRDPKFAIIAIDNYIQFPLNSARWYFGGHQCWHRAIGLSRTVRPTCSGKLDQIETSLIEAIVTVTAKLEVPVLQLSNALKSNDLGKGHANGVADKLECLAGQLDQDGNFDSASQFFSAAAEWFAYSDDGDKSIDMTVAQAEVLARQATARASSDKPSFGAAASLLEEAIQIFRTIPRVQRHRHGVELRIHELMKSLSEYREMALSQMIEFSGEPFDVSEHIQQARQAVSDKSAFEALREFTNLYRVDVKKLREDALESLDRTTFRNLVSSVMMSRDGRVIAKIPSILGQVSTSDDEVAVRAEMNNHYMTVVGVVVQALILPALEMLVLEHRLTNYELMQLARQSPAVPIDRQLLYSKALSFGFGGDFGSAVHLLVPQLEHLVRAHLKARGVNTIHLTPGGIESEKSLSALVDIPECSEIFGDNVTYELQALFCDPTGPNLRNDVAHGLVSDAEAGSLFAVYAWWFGLRLVLDSLWGSVPVGLRDGQQSEKSDSSVEKG